MAKITKCRRCGEIRTIGDDGHRYVTIPIGVSCPACVRWQRKAKTGAQQMAGVICKNCACPLFHVPGRGWYHSVFMHNTRWTCRRAERGAQ